MYFLNFRMGFRVGEVFEYRFFWDYFFEFLIFIFFITGFELSEIKRGVCDE